MNERTDYVGPVTAWLQGNPFLPGTWLQGNDFYRALSSLFYDRSSLSWQPSPAGQPLSFLHTTVTRIVSDAVIRQKSGFAVTRLCSKFSSPDSLYLYLRNVFAGRMNIEASSSRFYRLSVGMVVSLFQWSCFFLRWDVVEWYNMVISTNNLLTI